MLLTQEDFNEWLQHPCTKAFKKALYKNRESLKEGMIQGAYEEPLKVQGMAEAIHKILVLDYQDLIESLKEGQ